MRSLFPALTLTLGLGLSACAATPPATTSLRVKGAAPDATVTIDDLYIGPFLYVATPWRAMMSSSAVNQCGSRLPSPSSRARWRIAFS